MYSPPSSNQQFQAIKNTEELRQLANHFLPGDSKIFNLIAEGRRDHEILHHIKVNFKGTADSSRDYKLNMIADIISKHKQKAEYLDIGCGSGRKMLHIVARSGAIGRGADIASWGPYNARRIPFTTIQERPAYHIPLPSHSFDCITLLLVLHHVANIPDVLKECRRLLKPDGIIIVLDHDIATPAQHIAVDLQHRIFEKLSNEPPVRPGNYFTAAQLSEFFNKAGARQVGEPHIFDETANNYDRQYLNIFKN